MSAALELTHVTKTHPGMKAVVALDDVSLRIEAGELVAIVGPSGSGKSTLLAIAGTLERPTAGEVAIAGRSTASLSDGALSAFRSAHIGFVFQQFFLLRTQSALDNVANGLLYRGIAPALRRQAAAAALEEVGLAHRAAHRPSELSGGECQRVAIARALVGRPEVVLADEPTGNLDTATGAEVLSLLGALNESSTTIVIVTHSAEVAEAASRTVLLRDGRIERDSARVA